MIRWWRSKVEELAAAAPSFRGFLAKADSEGQPGPMTYNRTEADGANLFGGSLRPLPASSHTPAGSDGVAIWRSFSHPPGGGNGGQDQAIFQYDRFHQFDGQFLSNVVLQSKSGPFDFQVREPVHSLFGAMPKTAQIVEVEATQEYLGQAKHVVHTPAQWQSYLNFDFANATAAPNPPPPLSLKATTLAGRVAYGGGPGWSGGSKRNRPSQVVGSS